MKRHKQKYKQRGMTKGKNNVSGWCLLSKMNLATLEKHVPLEKARLILGKEGIRSLSKGKCIKKGFRCENAWCTRFTLIAFTLSARPDSFRHNFLVCDPNSVIIDSLESMKSLVSSGGGFTRFGLAV